MSGPYLFETHYHPYTCDFIGEVTAGRDGVMSLLRPSPTSDLARQRRNDKTAFAMYEPNPGTVDPALPFEDIDFSPAGAYSQYNWELFFHIPLLIATQLSQNQQFEDAQAWFHAIFDPTDRGPEPPPQRYWKTRPLFANADVKVSITRMLELLDAAPGSAVAKAFSDEIEQWMDKPFNPHLIARGRWSAYQKTVVMKYLDNLIVWGDHLFARETIESINEATQLYVLAAEILGERPRQVPERNPKAKTYREIGPALDAFSNAAVALEGYLPPSSAPPPKSAPAPAPCRMAPPTRPEELATLLSMGQSLYFCVPQNEILLGYWDTVADRLFKVRNCMDLEGRVRQLPLFEPPIDPALLVRATAAGIDLGSVLDDLYAPRPHYRFATMLQRALDYSNEVKSLGTALLAAMEKRDGEELARLRSTHEIALLDATRDIKHQQVDDATHALDALLRTREMVAERHAYYDNFERMTDGEKLQVGLIGLAEVGSVISAGAMIAAAPLHKPMDAGFRAESVSKAVALAAGVLATGGAITGIQAGFSRRKDDADLQTKLATHELAQLDAQILAAEVRVAIAKAEYDNLGLQRRQAKDVDDQMRRRFTNRELYTWTVAQVSKLYFQTYRLARDFARRVEKTLAYELGPQDAASGRSYVDPGSWDSLRKGLLAGERLALGLRRMEVAFLDANRRELEISKSISLAMLDPVELVRLKQTGQATIRLPEALFDRDHPGHYLRRIKTVALTVPCVTGPYTSVNCSLTLMRNGMRHDPRPPVGGKYEGGEGDPRFTENVAAIQSIVTSTGINDSGLFEPNLRDERYLPFEGAGADSDWLIELPQDTNHFDVQTITDVILHLRYTARDGGEPLRRAARSARVIDALPHEGLIRLFSAKHEFADAWYRFSHPGSPSSAARLDLDLSEARFPFHPPRIGGKPAEIQVTKIDFFLSFGDVAAAPTLPLDVVVTGPAGAATTSFTISGELGGTAQASISKGLPAMLPLPLAVVFPSATGLSAVRDLLAVCKYELVAASP